MIIQSKRVWVLGQWLEAQVEVEEGKIKEILPMVPDRQTRTTATSVSFLDSSTSIPMALMDLIPMTQRKKDCATG